MSDSEVKVVISGESAGVAASMQQAAAAVKEGVASMQASIASVTESFAGFGEMFTGIAGLLAGGALFKEIISQTREMTGEALSLGLQLGISASEAGIYAIAIESVGGKTDDFSSAMRGLNRQIKLHEGALNDLGVKTRDANGNLLAGNVIFQSAVDVVNSYKQGIDRAQAAQEIFGRGVTDTNAAFRMNDEVTAAAREEAEALGLTIGEHSKQAFLEYRTAMESATKTLQGLEKAIGDALMPVLTQFAQWFREVGPAAIIALKGALAALLTPIWILIDGFNTLADIVQGVFNTMAIAFVGMARAGADAVSGHMAKAKDDLKQTGTDIQANWKHTWDQIGSDAQKAHDNIVNLWTKDKAIPEPTGGKDYKKPASDKQGSDNRLALMKNQLDEMSQATGDFDKKDIAAQQQYWQSILDNTKGGTKEDEKLRTEIEKEINALKKKAHDEAIKEQEEYLKTVEALQLGEVAAKQAALAQELALGKITEQQFVEQSKDLEDQRFEITSHAIDARLALSQHDLLGQQKLKDQELTLEQKHAADVQKIVDKAALDENKTWQDLFKKMESGFATTISGFLKGTQSLGATIKGLYTNIATSVADTLAQMAARNIATMLAQAAVGDAIRAKQILADAYKAASGAYSAVAGIPYVGPFLAPVAAAVAFGAVMAFDKSAAGGYDIPSGTNPVTQLHAQEMVLPAPLANAVRNMAGGGRGSGATFNVSAIDARSFAKFLDQNAGTFAAALNKMNNRFMGR